MAFSDKEMKELGKELVVLIEPLRPKEEIRSQLGFQFDIDQQNASVVIIEVRPNFFNPSQQTLMPVAKAKYNKSKEMWSIYWMRATEKWEKYPEEPFVPNLKQFFRVVKEDKLCCFFG